MKAKEAIEKLRKLAQGKYFSARVERTERTDGEVNLEYSAYIEGPGWSVDKDSWEEVIAELIVLYIRIQTQKELKEAQEQTVNL